MFLLYKLPKTFFVLVSILLFSVPAFALSADDFIPPAQAKTETQKEQLSTVQNESAVHTEKDENLGVEVVKAATLQDAINSIIKKQPRGGCQMTTDDNGGVVFVATGIGTYRSDYSNVVASRIEQRNAYVVAFMMAKSQMIMTAAGLAYRGATDFDKTVENLTNETRSLNNIETQLSESQKQIARKVLKGYVTYSVFDDGKSTVQVTIVSSPKSRGKYTRFGNNGITASSLREGLDAIIAEIKNNLVPPVGGRIVDVPETGEVAWVGFGSFIVRKDDEPDVQAELDIQAEQIAGMRAVDALAGIILGDDTLWEGDADEQTKRQVKDFERLQASDQTGKGTEEEIKAYDRRIKNMRNAVSSNNKVQSLRKGILPPGIQRVTEIDEDGYFAYGIAVYVPSVSELAAQAGREMDEIQIVKPIDSGRGNGKNSDGSSNFKNRNTNTNLNMKKGPSGIVNQNL